MLKCYVNILSKNNGIITKVLSYRDGEIVKDNSHCWFSQGTVEERQIQLSELPNLIRSLNLNQGLIFGKCKFPEAAVLSSSNFENQDGTITRTQNFFNYQKGQTGIGYFDNDPIAGNEITVENYIGILGNIFEPIENMAYVWTPSTSSCLYHNNKPVGENSGGMHLYFLAKDQSDLPRFSMTLFKRLWLEGFGHIKIARDGSMHARSIIDTSVFSPERIDFAAGAKCIGKLEQRLPLPIFQDGDILDTSKLKDLSNKEEKEFQRLVKEEKKILTNQSEKKKKIYIKDEIQKLCREKKFHEDEASQVITARLNTNLSPQDFIYFDEIGPVQISEIFQDPKKFDKHSARDPITPELGPCKAMFFANCGTDKPPTIHSFAHGGRIYHLSDSHPGVPPQYLVTQKGVFRKTITGEDEKEEDIQLTHLSSRIDVVAFTRDAESRNWGRHIHLYDRGDKKHKLALPMELFAGNGQEVKSILLNYGIFLSPYNNQRQDLLAYLQTCNPKKFVQCIDRTGWFFESFVLPDIAISANNPPEVILQSNTPIENPYGVKGSLKDWRENIAALAPGNTRLIFCICCAFAAPFLNLLGLENGGFHFVGPSSVGKSTVLVAASSVWGGENNKLSWRSTLNGIEGICPYYNDSLLVIDELKEADAEAAGQIAYLLGNGMGKLRAKMDGSAAPRKTWNLLFLSSGEITLGNHVQAAGKRIFAGQEVRMADIDALPDDGQGVFELIPPSGNAACFAEMINQNCKKFHGQAGRVYISRIIDKGKKEIIVQLKDILDQFCTDLVPKTASGQVHRVARRFGLVAAAGEIATELGITGWSMGESTKSAKICFSNWLNNYGQNNREDYYIIQNAINYLSQNSHLFPAKVQGKTLSPDIPGFSKNENGQLIFYIRKEIFLSDICQGKKTENVINVLRSMNYLIPDKSGKNTVNQRVPWQQSGTDRVFQIDGKIIDVS